MWPAFTDIGNTVMGNLQPGDATSGGVRLGWLLTMYGPFTGHSRYLAAPEGMPFWPFTYYTSLAWILPQWVLAHMTGGVASWNLITALGFVLDGLAMFGLVRWLTGGVWLALMGGILYAFSPFHVEESYAHVGYVWTWIFPLMVWACLWLARRPRAGPAIVVGALVGVGGYIDPYFLLFCPMLAGVMAVASFAGARVLAVTRVSLIRAYAIAAAVAFMAVLPLMYLYVTAPASSRWLVSSHSTLQVSFFQRAKLWEYVVPWVNSPLWGHWTSGWIKNRLGTVPPVETSLYLGIGVMVLAAGLWVCWARSAAVRDSDDLSSGMSASLALPLGFLAPVLLFGAGILMLCSFGNIGPFAGFPAIIWKIIPLWRALVRLDALVDCLVVVSACLGLLVLTRSRYRWAAIILAAFAFVDGTAIVPWESWSYAANTPPAYAWLAAHQDGGIVAEYPMLPPDLPSYIAYTTFQTIHHHPLFNGALPGSSHSEIERGVADLDDPQTIPTLRRFGVKYLVLDRPFYDNPPGTVRWGELHLIGLRLITRGQGLRLYRILPGPMAPATLAVRWGFGVEHPFLPRVERWMGGSIASLGIDRYVGAMPVRVSFIARSYKKPRPRELSVYQAGALKWSGIATVSGTRVSFTTAGAAPLILKCSPGSVHVHGFLDRRSVDVTDLDVTTVRNAN